MKHAGKSHVLHVVFGPHYSTYKTDRQAPLRLLYYDAALLRQIPPGNSGRKHTNETCDVEP